MIKPAKTGTPWTVFALGFLALLVIDQVVKAWARDTFAVHESPGYPFPGFFELTLTYNQGIAFGLLQGLGVLFAPVALVIAGFAGWYCHRHPNEPRITHFALALLAAGAVGNLIDRVFLGKVTDMFWVRFIQFPVFNVADICITVGAILLGIRFVFEHKLAPAATPQPPAETVSAADQ